METTTTNTAKKFSCANLTKAQKEIIETANNGKINTIEINRIYNAFYWSVFNLLLHNYCNRNVKDAEELTNDVFIKLDKYKGKYNNSLSQFHTFLYTMTNQSGIDYARKIAAELRKKNNNHLYLDDNTPENGPVQISAHKSFNADINIERKELNTKIKEAFNTLTPKAQKIMHLVLEGVKYETIAQTLGVTVTDVKVTVLRSRPKLQTALKKSL
jgi:RNA polymerase sigma factor (sigma-70 family)